MRKTLNPMAIIIAVDEEGGFGKDGKIPWHFPEDFKRFKETTTGHPCVMGRHTYTDMLEMRKARSKNKDQPIDEILPNRQSFVVTSDQSFTAPGATVVPGIREAVQSLDTDDNRTVFVLGGYRMFIEALTWADHIFMTVVRGVYGCDRFFPIQKINKSFTIIAGGETEDLRFITYKRLEK